MQSEPPNFDEVLRQRIIRALQRKAPGASCPICQKPNFAVLDAYTPLSLAQRKGVPIGERQIASVAVICENCGYILPFVVKALLDEGEAADAADDIAGAP